MLSREDALRIIADPESEQAWGDIEGEASAGLVLWGPRELRGRRGIG